MSETQVESSPFPPSPVIPATLEGDARLQFQCRKGIACWNACCSNIDISLTPVDIVRLKQRFELSSSEFLSKYTVPYEMAELTLQALDRVEQLGRLERGLDPHARVQKARLLEHLPHRVGVVGGGRGEHRHAGARQGIDGGLQVDAPIAYVRAESEQSRAR